MQIPKVPEQTTPYLIQDGGTIYPWTKTLAMRKDMRPYNGPLPEPAKQDHPTARMQGKTEDEVLQERDTPTNVNDQLVAIAQQQNTMMMAMMAMMRGEKVDIEKLITPSKVVDTEPTPPDSKLNEDEFVDDEDEFEPKGILITADSLDDMGHEQLIKAAKVLNIKLDGRLKDDDKIRAAIAAHISKAA